jgi:transposase-like protein
VSPNHRYQVMPDLSPEEYTALKADIDAHGVRIPIEVDEEGNIIDGFTRKRICDELGIDCPTNPFFGHTEEEKREHAWRLNLMRRHLTREQKREIARTLREEGWTQQRIAQALAIRQSTVSRWIKKFIQMDKLAQPATIQGSDGKDYPSTKEPCRPAQSTEGPSISENPLRSDADVRPAQASQQQEMPQPRGTHPEAQSSDTEPPIASDVPDAPERPSLLSDEWHPVPVGQASSLLGSSPGQPAEDDAKGWVTALQDLSAKLETLQAQRRLLPRSTDWTPDTQARSLATIRRIQGICSDLAALVEADMRETAARNGHDVGDTLSPFLPPSIAAVQVQRNGELVTVSAAEASVGEVTEGDQLPSQGGGEAKPLHEEVVPVQEEAKLSTPELPQAPTRPSRSRTRRSKAEVLAASTMGELNEPVPGASATFAELSGSPNDAALVKPYSPDAPSNNHCPDHDCPEQSSGSQEVCLDGSLQLNSCKPIGSAGAGGLPTANVPASASVAPLPLCPQCGSSNTWHIYGACPDRFACMACMHHFNASTPGNVPSTPSHYQ